MEKGKKQNVSTKDYLKLLSEILIIAVALIIITDGKMDISNIGKSLSRPTDSESNLQYGLLYHPSSDHILVRDNIIIKNAGKLLKAKDMESNIVIDAACISPRSDNSIKRIAEYVGYFYMYDGQTVYRSTVSDGIDGPVKTVVKKCLKFEPMGNYIYSLQSYHNSARLYRCNIDGTYEKVLFRNNILDFWAYGGYILMAQEDGSYRCYDTLTGNQFDHYFPGGINNICMEKEGIFYLKDNVIHRCSFLDDKDIPLLNQNVCYFTVGDGKIAFLTEQGGECFAGWCDIGDLSPTVIYSKSFDRTCPLEISNNNLFVTNSENETFYLSFEENEYLKLF